MLSDDTCSSDKGFPALGQFRAGHTIFTNNTGLQQLIPTAPSGSFF